MRSCLLRTLGLLATLSLCSGYQVQTPPLDTDWTYKVGKTPWPEYPRPLLQRPKWKTLNGVWQWKEANLAVPPDTSPLNETFTQDVLVPSCLESGLSGVMRNNLSSVWYNTQLSFPPDWGAGQNKSRNRVLLNFEAVDYEATVYVNSRKVASNRGGYWHFGVDITDYLRENGTNQLYVFVFDPTDSPGFNIPIGKQTLQPSHIFYTPCTGIWQSVWVETVPQSYISSLDVTADMNGDVNMTVSTSAGASEDVTVLVTDKKGTQVASHKDKANVRFTFAVPSPRLWSPNSPTLYNLTVTMGADTVSSYTGFRTFESGDVQGVQRPLLNGEFVFLFGTLDQGYWPDGIYTPPTYEAMVYDLKLLKRLGMNMVRKHIKVENALFYQACDQLGLMVIQDMPSMNPDSTVVPTPSQQAEFERQFGILVKQQKNNPSIVTWVVYNEGWGQIVQGEYPEYRLTARAKQLDPTRLVDSTTGWFDHGAGDWSDNHHYANPQCGSPIYSINSSPYDPRRIGIQGEFGGIGTNVSDANLWKVTNAVNTINQTYELDADLKTYNYRSRLILSELRDQVDRFSCSGAVWTQTTDVEGEVNGLITYDRRVLRVDSDQWVADIKSLYEAAEKRKSAGMVNQKVLLI